jgi:hypothetical protein
MSRQKYMSLTKEFAGDPIFVPGLLNEPANLMGVPIRFVEGMEEGQIAFVDIDENEVCISK